MACLLNMNVSFMKKNKQVDHLENLSCHRILMGLSKEVCIWARRVIKQIDPTGNGFPCCRRDTAFARVRYCIEMDHISYALLQTSIFFPYVYKLIVYRMLTQQFSIFLD